MIENQRSLGYQQITDLSGVVALTVPPGTGLCLIIPETQGVRYRDDGVNPTSSVGMPIAAGASLVYIGSPAALRFTQQSASAVLNVTYYG